VVMVLMAQCFGQDLNWDPDATITLICDHQYHT